jgi:prepilin-type N-terminal cleavage/methylation domain-containing protein/prepilin-type processing-associated H-X9-DG protein
MPARATPRWRRPQAKAFTLIELLLVIAVAGILAALLLPSLARAKQKARTAQCLAQLHQLGLAMSLYADEHEGLLPMAHATVQWNSHQPTPWTRPLLPYYGATNLLTCPAYCRVYERSPFSYFMGARSAFIAAGGQPASVLLTGILFPPQYILSGDSNYPFPADDADPDNYTQDTLFATNLPAHGGRVNILFADKHAATTRRFDRKTMTYSHTTPEVDWDDWDF